MKKKLTLEALSIRSFLPAHDKGKIKGGETSPNSECGSLCGPPTTSAIGG